MVSYSRSSAMTFIELMVFILLTTALALVAFINYRPTQDFQRVEKVLAQNQQLVMGMQAYHSIYGRWPDSARGCENALQVLQNTQPPIIAPLAQNAFGSGYSFECTPGQNQTLGPMTVTQSVPFEYLDYYRRYLYRVEVAETLSEAPPQALVPIRTRIPPTDVGHNIYFARVPFGNRLFSRPSLELAEMPIELNGISDQQAFVPMPIACIGLDSIAIQGIPNTFCPAQDFSALQDTAVFTLTGTRTTITGPVPFSARVEVTREVISDNLRTTATLCDVRSDGTLMCNHAASDGWLLSLEQDWHFRYQVNYRIGPGTPVLRSFSFTHYAVDVATDLRNQILNWSEMENIFSNSLSSQSSDQVTRGSAGQSTASGTHRTRISLNRVYPDDLSILAFEPLLTVDGSSKCAGEHELDSSEPGYTTRSFRIPISSRYSTSYIFTPQMQAVIQCVQ